MAIRELNISEIDMVSGGALNDAESLGVMLAGAGLVVAAVAAAPILTATALGWGFGSAVAWFGGVAFGYAAGQRINAPIPA